MKYEKNGSDSEPVATLEPTDQPLSLEEQRSLGGASPLALPEERLDVELPRQGWANSAVPRTVFVAGIIGSVCLFAFLFTMLFGGRQKVVEAPTTETETPAVAPDEKDKLKTELALVGQGQDQGIPAPGTRVRTPPVAAKPPAQRTVRGTPPQPQTQTQTRTITTRSAPSAPIAPAKPLEPPVDPFEQWNDLASAGTMRGNVDMQSFQEFAQPPAPSPPVRIASVTLGAGSLADISQPSRSVSQQPESPESIGLSPGANGILNRRPSVAVSNTGQIPIGAVAKAELMIPIIVAGGVITRSAVQLQEPLNDEQGNEVLPKGTIFITQITNVNESSRMIEQTAVAVRYQKNSQFVEENIPPGLVLIVNRNLEPLKADRIRSHRGFNVARGLAQAIASVGNEVGGSSGVVSDLLGELANQVRRRSNGDSRVGNQTSLSIKAGENVSVMVNGFLGVNP